MDRDRLQPEVDEWVEEGLITREQAEAILVRYESEGRSRIVTAISLLGAVLIGAGIVLYLAANWVDLSRSVRTVILLVAPAVACAGGWWLAENRTPRVGHALVILGVGLVGPSLFLLSDLYFIEIDASVLYVGWAAVALPVGHAIASRAATVLGIAAIGASIVVLASPADPVIPMGFYGVVLFALGAYRGPGYVPSGQSSAVAHVYRWSGALATLGALILLAALEGRFSTIAFEPTLPLAATAIGALFAALATAFLARTRDEDRVALLWPGIALCTLFAASGLAMAAPESVADVVAFGLIHLLSLSAIVATVATGYRTGSTALVNVAIVAFLAQLVAFLNTTVVAETSGALALIVVGVALLAAGVGVERGRRELLSRMSGS